MGVWSWIKDHLGWNNPESPLRRVFSRRGSKSKKKEKEESSDTETTRPTLPRRGSRSRKKEEESSDIETTGPTLPKPKVPENKVKGGRKRKFKQLESEPVREVQKDSVKSSKKSKKHRANENNRNTASAETQQYEAEGRVNLETNTDKKKRPKDVLVGVEQIKANISDPTTSVVQVGAVNENETPQVVNEYEEKCLKKITEIFEKSKEFEGKIDAFCDVEKSQAFYYIDESLQRNLEKLDRIDIMDSVLLKEERKKTIKYIYKQIERLEAKAKEYEDVQENEVIVD